MTEDYNPTDKAVAESINGKIKVVCNQQFHSQGVWAKRHKADYPSKGIRFACQAKPQARRLTVKNFSFGR